MKKFALMLLLSLFSINSIANTLTQKDSIESEIISYQLAIYLIPGQSESIEKHAVAVLNKNFPKYKLVKNFKKDETEIQVNFQLLNNAQESYAPPSIQMIGYFGRGLTKEQANEIQPIQDVLLITVAYGINNRWQKLQSTQLLVSKIADSYEGYIWDEETREIFTKEEYKKRRFFEPNQGAPSVVLHTVIHSYPNGEYVRAISLGMAKFGLPDIAVSEFSWSDNRRIGNSIIAISQLLVEGHRLNKEGEFTLDLTQIKQEEYKAKLKDLVLENATFKGKHKFSIVEPEEGDPNNLILEPIFDHDDAESKQEKQELFLSSIFGSKDEISYIKHNEELLKASQRAKEKLPKLQQDFKKGFEPGEYILLKAPFKTPDDGNEWMWVEVITWEENRIKGMLKNDPYHIPNLKAGAIVDIAQDRVFDYIRYFANGKSEGNETGEIIAKFEEK